MNINYTEEQLALLTTEEKALLNKRVIAIKDLDYGYFVIKQGTKGTIFDFSDNPLSSDPFIVWDTRDRGIGHLREDILIID